MTHPEFENKVIIYQNKLFRFAKRILDNILDAEDAVQEILLKLWENHDKLKTYRSVEALAMITVKNTCLDKLKKQKNKILTGNKIMSHKAIFSRPEVENKEFFEMIQDAIVKLPQIQQLIVHLRDVEGYEFSEISLIVEMNEQAIRTALSRARKRLRELLVESQN